jgi:putative acetyltransferase
MSDMSRGTAFRFRTAEAKDGPAIRSVIFSVLQEHGLRADPGGTDSDLDDIVRSYIDRGGAFRVLVSPKDDVVGCGGLYPLDGADAEVRKMYLLPHARGQGFGRALLTDLIATANARGFRRVFLETASVLREAIALYVKFGFRPVRRGNLTSRCDQAYVLELGDGDRGAA